ncbi:ankyrin repeat-containing domain protein [Xylariaceae sp. FL1019]|nr:ankyrin repeat-containing domain protein [Xylariaceae sp. FL1019]
MATLLLDRGARPADEDVLGVLFEAIDWGSVPIVTCLFENVAPITCETLTISRMLKRAIASKSADIDKGAAINDTIDGATPLSLAGESQSVSVAELLSHRGAIVDPEDFIHYAARNVWIYMVQHMIDRGAKVDFRTSAGQRLLVKAVQSGKTDVVELLLHHGSGTIRSSALEDAFYQAVN